MTDKFRWRAEIAFGLAPRSELKAWREKYERRPATQAGSWYKSAPASVVKTYGGTPSTPKLGVFTSRATSYHAGVFATKSATDGIVWLRSDGRQLWANDSLVTSVKRAGMSDGLMPVELVTLMTEHGRAYFVERAELKKAL